MRMREMMVVDDDRESRQRIKTVIKQSSYNYFSISEIDCMSKGIKLLKKTEPVILFVELTLPDGNGIELGKRALDYYPHVPVVIISQLQMFEPLQEAMNAGFSGYLLKPISKSDMLHTLDRLSLKGLVREVNDMESKRHDDVEVDLAHPIQTAIKYIHLKYQEPLTLKEVANFVYLSPSYFSRMFKGATGTNFIEYVTQYRIEKSKNLLKMTKLPIEVIANHNGFSSAAYFSTTFKRLEGVTPGEYREMFEQFMK